MRIVLLCCLLICISSALGARAEFIPIPLDASADQTLDALKLRGDTTSDFTADVKLTVMDEATADSTTDIGKVLFQKLPDDNERLRIAFSQRIEGNKTLAEKHEYTVADRWYIDRDYQKKNEKQYEVVKPGEKINLLKLGQGPFPLPIGQDKQEVYKEFDVAKAPAAQDDPQGTIHLVLKPKLQTDLARRVSQIDLWVDCQLGMPVKIVSQDVDGEHLHTAELSNIHLNQNLTDADFTLPPVGQDWDVTVQPLQK